MDKISSIFFVLLMLKVLASYLCSVGVSSVPYFNLLRVVVFSSPGQLEVISGSDCSSALVVTGTQ